MGLSLLGWQQKDKLWGIQIYKGRWDKVIKKMIKFYNLKSNARILDVGCGKGFFLADFKNLLPDGEFHGVDVSKYALKKSHQSVRDGLITSCASKLPWSKNYFDLVVSFNTFHNLYNFQLIKALKEFERVGKKNIYALRLIETKEKKMNLLYWQVTCESFCTPKEWEWWFKSQNILEIIHIFSSNDIKKNLKQQFYLSKNQN